ncbi:MAG: energy transducer TonB [Acidobacteriota bacterium]
MFDQLVVSSLQRRKHTAAKYFVGTGALYVLAIACAFVASVLMSDPKLADTHNVVMVGPSLPPALGEPRENRGPQRRPQTAARPNPYNVQKLVDVMSHRTTAPPTFQTFDPVNNDDAVGPSTGPIGGGSRDGVYDGDRRTDSAPRPEPPRPQPAAQTAPAVDNRPMRIPSSILQGKAIERRTPIYPVLAKQIRLQGEVSIEVMIAPDGHVESARIVSGRHPILDDKAREAALGWRFQPTLLNNVPVRVTGVIVFVFKLSE